MKIDPARLRFLLQGYANDTCSREQMKELFEYIRQAKQDAPLNEALFQEWQEINTGGIPGGYDWDEMFRQITKPAPIAKIIPIRRNRFPRTAWIWHAAALLVIAGVAGYFFYTLAKNAGLPGTPPLAKLEDIPPGGNKAMLTLADGSVIVLDSARNGTIAQQGGAKILKPGAGKLSYEGAGNAPAGFNTVTTPKGGQYQVTLSDGTRVWLNAASSIRFPTLFTGKHRKVEVSGEAYFEVAGNEQHPFLVDLKGDCEVEVLGTHFNVNNYSNEENVRTTLLQGSIRVTRGKAAKLLRPGEQAVVKENIAIDKSVNMDEVMAWKNGFFNLQNKNLDEVMKQLERWYDIDVRYEGKAPEILFTGDMDRGVNLSEVLGFLSESGVKLRLEGRTVVVQ
jgi:ferric-dicitrate binding protein FerR (iron transport regulator)